MTIKVDLVCKTTHQIPKNFTGTIFLEGLPEEWGKMGGAYLWTMNGKTHREHSPACIWDRGDLFWIQGNTYHRLDGPAIVRPTGTKEYFICGHRYDEEKYWNHPLVLEHKLNKVLTED